MSEKVTLKNVYDELRDFRKEMSETYVSQGRFAPVEKIVYGAAGLTLLTVFGALIAQVVQAGS